MFRRFSNVLLIVVKPVTSTPIYNTTFVLYGIFVLGGNKYVIGGSIAFKVIIDAIITKQFFGGFTKTSAYCMDMYPLYVLLFVPSIVRFILLKGFTFPLIYNL